MALDPEYYPSYSSASGNNIRQRAQQIQRFEQQPRTSASQSSSNEPASSTSSNPVQYTITPRSILRTSNGTRALGHAATSSEHRYNRNISGHLYRPRPVLATSVNAMLNASSPEQTHDDDVSIQGTSSSAGSYHVGSPTRLQMTASLRYPELHFMLASDSTQVLYDVRVPPSQGIEPALYNTYSTLWTSREPVKHMRLISRDFPWSFDIRIPDSGSEVPAPSPRAAGGSGSGSTGSISPTTGLRRRARFDIPEPEEESEEKGVKVGFVWDVLYRYLQAPVQPAEWVSMIQMLEPSEARTWRRAIEGYAERRRVQEGGDQLVIRRVDWLGRRCIFRGLGKDDDYAKLILLPGEQECSETWVVKFTNAPQQAT